MIRPNKPKSEYKIGDYLRAGVFYGALGLVKLGIITGSGCKIEHEPEPEPQKLTEDEGVQRVRQVLGSRGIIVEKYDKMVRIFDPVKGYEVTFFPDLANEGDNVFAEYLSDIDKYSPEQVETIENLFNGPGVPAMLAISRGTAEEVENSTNDEADDWGL